MPGRDKPDALANTSSSKPATRRRFAHIKVADALRKEISTGSLQSGDQLPTELELVARFDVSRHTVRAALGQLERDGLISRRAGHGTFVTPYATDPANVHMTGDDQHIFGLASWPPVDLVQPLHFAHDPDAAKLFGASNDTVLRLAYVRAARGQRVGYWLVSMPAEFEPQIAPALADFDGSSATIIAILESVTGRTSVRAEQMMTAESARKDLAELLKVKRNAPLLRVERTYFDRHERPLQHVLVRFVPAHFSYRLNILRTPAPRGSGSSPQTAGPSRINGGPSDASELI